jgi:hypothetical protein
MANVEEIDRKDVLYQVKKEDSSGCAAQCFSCGTWREITQAHLSKKDELHLPCPKCGMDLWHTPIVAQIKEAPVILKPIIVNEGWHFRMEALKECPFCGGEAYIWSLPGAFRGLKIGCRSDCVTMPPRFDMGFTSASAAVKAWNKRTEVTKKESP